MNLIKELQSDILNQEVNLSSILRKAKVLATNIKNEEMKKWIDSELNGYKSDYKKIPEYRIGHSDIYGDFINSFGIKMNNMQIPIFKLHETFKNINNEVILTRGIRNLESLLESDEKKFKKLLPSDVVTILSNRIYENFTCLQAWKSMDRGQIEQVLDIVRNRLLNFVLELQEMYPEINKSEDAIFKIPNDAMNSVFNNFIIGNNNIVSGGSNIDKSSQINTVNKNIAQTTSAPIIKDVIHEKNRDIYYGNKVTQIINDNSTYDINKENVAILEKASIFITNKYSLKKITFVGFISLVSGFITIFSTLFSFYKNYPSFSWIPDWFPSIPITYSIGIFVIGLALILFGYFLISIIQYKNESKCPKCERFYALKEVGNPTEKEVKVRNGVRMTTLRSYECKYDDCDFKITKKKNRFIRDSELWNN